jgi:hypothetical protein
LRLGHFKSRGMYNAKKDAEGKRLSGNRGKLRREKKTNFAFRLIFKNGRNYGKIYTLIGY